MVLGRRKRWLAWSTFAVTLHLFALAGCGGGGDGDVSTRLESESLASIETILTFPVPTIFRASVGARLVAGIADLITGIAWAQSLSDMASVRIQISAPDIVVPEAFTVPVSNSGNGSIVALTIQAAAGANRTIKALGLNPAGNIIFSGIVTGVALQAGSKVTVEIRMDPFPRTTCGSGAS